MRNAILFLVLLVGIFHSNQLIGENFSTKTTKNKHDDRAYPNSDNSPTNYSFGIKLTLEREDVTCANERDGWIKAIVSGGVGPYSYLWSNGATTSTIDDLDAGDYKVTVTDDATGQTKSIRTLIEEPNPIVLNPKIRHISCGGTNDGVINIRTEGGIGPYSYIWGMGGDGPVRANLTPGRYSVTVTDANGCTVMASPEIRASSIPSVHTETFPENCSGIGNDGKVRIEVSGDSSPFDIVWSTGDRQKEALSSLSSGDYTVTVTNAIGCSVVETLTVVAAGEDILDVQLTADEYTCGDTPTGSASVSVTGGQAPFTYTWSNGATSPAQDNLYPGNYTITVRDHIGCSKEVHFTIKNNPVPRVNLHSQRKVCFGESDGGIQSTVTGGSAPYTYLWSNGSTDPNLTNIPEGSYSLTVTDAFGCTTVNDSKVLSHGEIITSILNINEVSCSGGNDGQISVESSGGSENGFSYAWSNGQTSTSIANLEAGTYTLSVTDIVSVCVTTKEITVPEPPAIVITSSVTPASDENTADGSASVNISGGTPGYTYSWSNGATTSTISNVPNGTYTVTVTDALACTASTSVLVEASCTMKIKLFPSPSNCQGNEGNIVADVTDTNLDVTYQWSNGQTGRSVIGLAAGYYSVIATDAAGCTVSAGITVGDECPCSNPIINNIVVINATSPETADGSIHIAMESSSFNYQWSDPSINGANATNVAAGTYTVTITDTRSTTCATVETITIGNSSLPIKVVSTTATECGKEIGSAVLDPPNFTYEWSDGQSGASRNNLAAGTFTVTATDPSRPDLQDVLQVNIETEGGLVVSPTINEFPVCGFNNGSVSINVIGGSGDYSYGTWGTTNTRTDLIAGTYTLEIVDNVFGCTESFTFALVNQGANIDFDITNIQAVSCTGGTDGQVQFTTSADVAQVRVVDGLGMEYNATNLAAGDYCLEALDADGCLVGAECFEITQPDPLFITINRIRATCSTGGSIQLNVLGGNGDYQINWNDLAGVTNELTRTNVPSGAYAFTLSDSKNCTASNASIQITQIAGPTLNVSATGATTNSTTDGTATVVPIGGAAPYTYQWNNDGTTATINNIAGGTYSVTVTDANGCSEVSTVTVPVNCLLSAAISINTPAGCLGTEGSISATISGTTQALSYTWSNGATGQTINGLAEGYYSVTATDAAGCVISTGAMVQSNCACSEPVIGSIVVIKESATDAKNGSIQIQMQSAGSYSYQWSDPTINGAGASGLMAGAYTVTIIDAISSACVTTERILVGNSEIGFIKVVSTTNTECGQATGSAELDPSNFTYAWSDGQSGPIRNDLAAGIYTITATDPANPGLQDFIQVTIESEGGLVLTPVFNNLPDCGESNGSVSLEVSGGSGNYSYGLWGNTNTRTDLTAGTYTVEITDNTFGCTELYTFALNNAGANIEVTVTNSIAVSCVGFTDGQVQFTTSSNVAEVRVMDGFGNSYDANALPAGDYCLEAIDAEGCIVGSACFEITAPDLLYVGISRTQPTCATGGTINLDVQGGNGNYQVNWNDLAGSTDELIRNNVPEGVYAVTISDAKNCSASVSSVQLDQIDGPILDASASASMTNSSADGSATVSVSGGQAPYTYQWNDGNSGTTATINNIPAGTYTVTVTDANGCAEVTSVIVSADCLLQATIATTNVGCAGGSGQLTANIANANGALSYAWSNGNTGQTITNLNRGLYSVTATDALGCTITASASVDSDCNCVDPTIISTIVIEASGLEEADGVVTLSVNGGNENFNFQWSNGQNSSSITGLNPATYTVTISDKTDSECELVRDILVGNSTTKVGPIEITASTNSECGQNNGTAQLFPTGLDYAWSDGGTGFSRTNLAPGTYTVTATFESLFPGESDVKTIVITSEGGLDANAIINQQPDCGANNGSATIQANGGSGNYTYDWGSSIGATRTDLIGGTYAVTVTDQLYNCVEVLTFLLPNKSDAVVSITSTTPVTCPRGSDGSVQFDITTPPNVATPVTTTIKDGAGNTYDATALPAGDYCLEVTDATDCIIGGECFEITEPDELFLEISRTPVTCSRGGIIIAKASGGNDDFSFDWIDIDGTNDGPTRSNLQPGTYAVLATDQKGCSIYANNIPLAEPKEPTATLSSSSPATLLSNDGSVTVVTEGGVEPFRYLWSNNNGNMPNNPNLGPGPYSVTVVDANGCVNILNDTLEAVCTFDIKPNSNVVGCSGNDGSIDLDITGGTGTISYMWSNGATTASINNLLPEEYTVTVTDQGDCRYEETFTIGEFCDCNNVMIEDVQINQLAECGVADGSAEILVANTNADVSYSWGNGPIRNDLEAGDYNVTVTDNISGCTKVASFTLGNQPAAATVNIVTPLVNCFNDTGELIVDITPSACFEGPMDVTIVDANGTAFPIDELPAGDYELIVFDANGVEIQREAFSVTSRPEIGIDFDVTPSSCDGPGAINLAVVGGNDQFSFDWQDQDGTTNGPNRTNLTPGRYELFLTDNTTGCVSESSYTVAAEGLEISSIDTIYTCDRDQVQLAVDNNKPEDQLSYEWTPSIGIVAGTDTGTPTVSVEGEQVYNYTVQNQFGCEETGSVTVISAMTRPPASIDQALQCDGRTVDFQSSGGALGNYIWDFGDGTTSTEINPSHEYAEAGNYTVGLRLDPVFPCADALGLMSEQTLNVLEDVVTEASFEIDYDPCVDEGLITFRNTSNVSPGPTTYNWDFGNGMTSTEENPQIKIEDNTSLDVTLTVSTDTGCETQFTKQEPFQIFRFPTVSDTVLACPNVATAVNPDGLADLKYSWTPAGVFDNSNSASPLITVDRTTLIEVVISQDMCETKSAVLVEVPDEVDFDKTDDMVVCSTDEVEITANFKAEGTLIWSESPSFDPVFSTAPSFTSGPGEYFFQFTDENGCTIEDAVLIENATPTSDIIADDPVPLCLGASTMLSVRNGNPAFDFISYEWLPDPSIQSTDLSDPRIQIAPTITTDYTVIVMNIAGCEDTLTTTVEVVDLETMVDLTSSRDSIFISEEVDLDINPSTGLTVIWSDDSNAGPTRTVMPMDDTVYEATITDENGCTTTKTVMVTVQNPECGPPNIFFPNAFSPNGDGINDVLRVRGNGLQEVFWVVQNRWGEEVFRANSQEEVWDGTFNGKLVDPDVYGYVLRVTCFSGEVYEEQGNVTVIR